LKNSEQRLAPQIARSRLKNLRIADQSEDHSEQISLLMTKAFRQQRRLPAIRPLNEAPHLIPPRITQESYRENQIQQRVFTQPGPEADSDRLCQQPAECEIGIALVADDRTFGFAAKVTPSEYRLQSGLLRNRSGASQRGDFSQMRNCSVCARRVVEEIERHILIVADRR
jgi:hypothetical protein